MLSFFGQVYLLLWKISLQKLRRPLTTLCELICPIGFLLLLVLIRSLVKVEVHEEQWSYIEDSDSYMNSPLAGINATLCKGRIRRGELGLRDAAGMIGVYPKSNASETLMNKIAPEFNRLCGFFHLAYGDRASAMTCFPSSCQWSDYLYYFDSKDAIEEFVLRDGYGQNPVFNNKSSRSLGAALIFNDISPTSLDYVIRYNVTLLPPTNPNEKWDKFSAGIILWYTWWYRSSGFITLQKWIDLAHIGNFNIGIGDFCFPTPGYTTDEFSFYTSFMLSNFMMLAFTVPFSVFAKNLVEEKQMLIKESIQIVGCTEQAYWSSWILSHTVFAFVISLCYAITSAAVVFPYSDPSLLFVYFFLFQMQLAPLAIIVSSVFDSPKVALIMCWFLFFFLMSGSSFITSEDGTVPSMSKKHLLCGFNGPACFTLGLESLGAYEGGGVGLNWENAHEEYYNFRFISCIWFLVLDFCWYCILGLYLDKVFPSKYGTKLKPWFCFEKKYYRRLFSKSASAVSDQCTQSLLPQDNDNLENIQPLPEDTKLLVETNDLLKVYYDATTNKKVHAVKGINLRIPQDQVFCLLGHNGAGKTTTISMLTGLIPHSSGIMRILGKPIDQAKDQIGVCPQINILFPLLKTKEHLTFFASLKGVPRKELKAVVSEIASSVGLLNKMNSQATSLSGGQKRKLSVGMAIMGKPAVLFLDEPSSGMDVEARRKIWDLIRTYKKGRCVVLTTHSMDEADILGDRIAIMAHGNIHCCGSSIFLKEKYGVGYQLVISMRTSLDKKSTDENDFDREIKRHLGLEHKVELLSAIGGEIIYRIPFDASPNFTKTFHWMDEKMDYYGIESYGIGVTTLDEVFQRVGESTQERRLSKSVSINKDDKSDAVSVYKDDVSLRATKCLLFLLQLSALFMKRVHKFKRSWISFLFFLIVPVLMTILAVGFISTGRQSEFDILTFGTEPEFTQAKVPYNSYFGEAGPRNTYEASKLYIDGCVGNGKGLEELAGVTHFGDYREGDYRDEFAPMLEHKAVKNGSSFQQKILDSMSRKNIRYLGFFFPQYERNVTAFGTRTSVAVGYNTTYKHGFPTAVNLATTALLKQKTGNTGAKITTSYWPFPFTQNENEIWRFRFSFTAVQTLTIAFCFLPMLSISGIMEEKITLAKHQQMVSGAFPAAYWLSNWAFDAILMFLAEVICMIIIFIGDKHEVFTGNASVVVLITLFFYAWSVVPMTYCLTFFFSTVGFAQTVIFFFYFLAGFVMNIVAWILDFVLEEDDHTNRDLKLYFYRIFPPFCMGENLLNIALRDISNNRLFEGDTDPWSMGNSGRNIIWMLCTGIVFFILVVLMDICDIVNWILYILRPVTEPHNEGLDSDVLAEIEMLKTGQNSHQYTIEVHGLEKAYGIRGLGTPLHAVKGIWFGVKKGEIFGFLGTNGAGKTTTLGMLTGVHRATKGTATICNFSINDQLNCRQKIGFCPQFDAIFNLLSSREHLELYCSLKGINEKATRTAMINKLITDLGLTKYADQAAGQYSGGNKRKLSCAIALIGDPEVVILDEPSSGMDPISKRFMWEFIAKTMHNRSVILTTHSMEECLALCHRIGIMVQGNLRCLGTAQKLQSRFGNGYELDLNTTQDKIPKVLEFFQNVEEFESAQLIESFDDRSKIRLTMFQPEMVVKSPKQGEKYFHTEPKKISLGSVFEIVERAKSKFEIKNYALSQTTLEQIFINFARIKNWN